MSASVIWKLRYILFHHQTTTNPLLPFFLRELRYILFHHQTTTFALEELGNVGCVISSFITKPQLRRD